MTEEEKKLNAQKYFIFKLMEYFRNSYGVLQNKRYDSLIAACEEIVDIQDEINRSRVDTTPLQKSLENLLEAFRYQWVNHPLLNHEILKKDLINLVNRIKPEKENDSDYYITIYNSIRSFLKKIDRQNILKLYIEVIKNQVTTFGEVDKMLDSFVSELMFQGYSLKYLEEWYLDNIQPLIKRKNNDASMIEKSLCTLGSLSCTNNRFYAVFACKLPGELQKELEREKQLAIRQIQLKCDENVTAPAGEKSNLADKLKFLHADVMACDKYKAIEIIKNSVESYCEIFKILNQSSRLIINDKTVFYISEDNKDWQKVVLEDVIHVNNRMLVINRQEREDIRSLISLRRNFNGENGQNPDISVIERTLEITKNALELSPGNRLLNIWSGLEYLSTFYYRDKIIERVRGIIPRVICLYHFKNKMNVLWDRMKYYYYKEDMKNVKACMDECCKGESISEYDLVKFAGWLSDMGRAKELYVEFYCNILVQREISEMNGLLLNKDGIISTEIKDLNELIKQDLNRIYRVRNKLAHSGSNVPENIDIFTYRLHKYVNTLLSSLIYCIKRNPGLTITEILYSVVETYDWYIDFISGIKKDVQVSNIKDLILPVYLYL